ncbi:hypothetical protein FB446DRAFT_743908 [Lentinula raphanica]|nr:hypothetical protein FB446DRAFT_743908 [Lentinula raphanica]
MLYKRWDHAMVYLAITVLVGTARFASAAPLAQATTTTTSRSPPENAVLLVHPWPRDPFSDDPTIAYPPPAKPFKAFGSLPSTSKAEKPLRLDRMHADWGDNRRLSILTEDSEVPQPPQKKSKSQSQSQSRSQSQSQSRSRSKSQSQSKCCFL